MAGWEEAWVTAADNDEVALNALILATSLRWTMTNKKMLISIGPSVTKEKRKQLKQAFDAVSLIDTTNKTSFTNEALRMFCMHLTLIKKFIYINPNTLIIRNLDHLFKSFEETRIETSDGSIILAMIVNSFDDFEDTIYYNEKNFEQWLQKNKSNKMDKKMFGVVDFFGNDSKNSEFVIYFPQNHPLGLIKKHGLNFVPKNITGFEMNILNFWKEMYCELEKNILTNNISDNWENEPIAIVGMACRLPQANNPQEFWNLMINKVDTISPVPDTRWTKQQFPYINDDEKKIQAGFLKCAVDEFDGKFFGMSPLELSFADPQQRLLMEVVWEALEDGGIDATSIYGSQTSIFTGTWTNDYKDALNKAGEFKNDYFRSYMGNSFGASAGRIAHFFGTLGSNIATESGCSSSMVAVGLACDNLRNKNSDIALACGVNLLLHPFQYQDMSFVLSNDGRCKTFDKDADGFGRGEGVGVLVLKRLSDAVHDNDRILALIRGYGQSQEGCSKSMGTPTVACESLAMNLALKNASIKACQVSYVESHGTGTPVGDPMEMAAIAQVYSQERNEPLFVGSVKSNVGHTESCSGITGIIKTILSLQKETIPPHIGCKNLNPKIQLDSIPAIIPMEATPWKRVKGKPRIAGVSSFGITGTDAHVIIQEAPDNHNSIFNIEKLSLNILAISAKTEESFNLLLESYHDHLEQNSLSMADVAYTANTGRAHLNPFRGAIIGSNTSELVKSLKSRSIITQKSFKEPKLAFLFSGQGAQYHQMGKQLYETFPTFLKHLDYCINVLESYGIHLKEVVWGSDSQLQINDARISQPSIFCVEYATFKLWESWGIKPDMVSGHSLGEFAATVAAGIWGVDDALKILATRTHLLEKLDDGRMLVIQADEDITNQLLKQLKGRHNFWLDIACINSPTQTVLSGLEVNIKMFAEFCTNNNIKTQMVQSNRGYHSRQMDPMLKEYKKILESVNYHEQTCDYISGNTGRVLKGRMTPEYWTQHLRDTVRFRAASVTMYEKGARICLDVSPHPIVASLFATNVEQIESKDEILCVPSLRKGDSDLKVILNAVGNLYCNGFDINWSNFHKHFQGKKISLPKYPFIRKKYWFDVASSKKLLVGGGGKELHPLVGQAVPNATSNKIFQSLIQTEKESYLMDHMIGKHVIFPGAGYIEMSLAAGYASTLASFEEFEIPTTSLTIKNVKIELPLEVNSEEGNELQIILAPSKEDEDGLIPVSIYQHQSNETETKKWTKHCTAFISFIDSKTQMNKASLDIPNINENSYHEETLEPFYEKLSTLGLNFGSTFRSLKQLWKNKDNGDMTVKIYVPFLENDKFLCHPVLIDGMIQALMMHQYNNQEIPLCVPIYIETFTWFAKYKSENNYIHATQINGEREARLYDQDGTLLALMSGAQIIETDLESITRAIESQKISLPPIYDEVWRPDHSSGFSDPEDGFKTTILDSMRNEIAKLAETYAFQELELERNLKLKKCVSMKIISSLHILDSNIGPVIKVDDFIKKCGIIPQNRMLFRRFLEMLKEDGYLEEGDSPFEFNVIKPLPTDEQAKAILNEINFSSGPCHIELEFLNHCTINLIPLLLQGKETVLDKLFPEGDSNSISADTLYRESGICKRLNCLLADSLTMLIKNNKFPTLERDLKILEIGAGTGSATHVVLPILRNHNINFKYTYTDLSNMFFIKAEKKFEQFSKHLKYKILNIENDPMAQGFAPFEYDIVIASNVLHATADMKQTIRNTRHLMKNNGLLFILETFTPIRYIDATFGFLEGYWRFKDFDLRPHHTLINDKQWSSLLEETGFSSNTTVNIVGDGGGLVLGEVSNQTFQYHCPEGVKRKLWILNGPRTEFQNGLQQQLELSNRVTATIEFGNTFARKEMTFTVRPWIIDDYNLVFQKLKNLKNFEIEGVAYTWGIGSESKQEVIAQGLLNFMKSFIVSMVGSLSKFLMATEGAVYTEDQEPTFPKAATLWGMAKAFKGENLDIPVRIVDIEPDAPTFIKIQQVLTEMWRDDVEMSLVYRNRVRHHGRCIQAKFNQVPLNLPNSERFSLQLPASKSISDLKFYPLSKPELSKYEIEIVVKASSLNFKDVLSVLKPTSEFDTENSIGADFSGMISAVGSEVTKWKVGDSVIGCNFIVEALPSHIKALESSVVALPNTMTYAEGSTLSVVFATAYHCLVNVGKLQKDETVLIHTASGGVGIIAIQIAKEIGAKIIATAGNKRKRAFLREVMGLEHIFHSRDLSFGENIKQITKGRGVEMILNSLTSPGFKETSLEVCTKNARFIEMSKLNIWKASEVKEMRPDVTYTIVDLTTESRSTWEDLFQQLSIRLGRGSIRPIPYTPFDAVYIRNALTYLQKAKHIGKVVCLMPKTTMENGELMTTTHLFNGRSTYLITGGLGGIGIEVTKWMSSQGALYFVLMGRNKASEKASQTISSLNSIGRNINVIQGDVGKLEDCENVLKFIKESNLPPLKGIMHVAGCLSDALIINQTWEKYENCYNAKVNGAWNLHNLTKNTCQLEHFVMFSSYASIVGSLGQSNHASANAYLDALAQYRVALGLPGTTVNWGQWGQVGVVADTDLLVISPFTPLQAFNALELILKSHRIKSAVVEMDINQLLLLNPTIRHYFSEVRRNKTDGASGSNNLMANITSEKFWVEYDASDYIGKRQTVETYLSIIVSGILRLDEGDKVDISQSFQDMGLDSLMMVELKNILQVLLGSKVTLTVTDISDCNTVNLLTNRLIDMIEGTNLQTEEDLRKLVSQDEILPDLVKPIGPVINVKDIKSVLVLGATGNLGSHVLEMLSKNPQISKIVCIIREKNDASAKEKLIQNLNRRKILQNVVMNKVQIVCGDIALEKFGLNEKTYATLSEDIDAIFNCSVKAHHLEEYRKHANPSTSDIRSINVIGTINVLKFAATHKTKWVYQGSTLAYVTETDSDIFPETWPSAEDSEKFKALGYTLSKFIGDRLVAQAVERGIPCKSFRFPYLAGDSRSGNVPVHDNHIFLRYIAYMKMGVMPSLPLPMMLLPVDIAARISVEAFLADLDLAPIGLYNVTNPHSQFEHEFAPLSAELGYPIKIIDFEEFAKRVQKDGESSPLYLVQDIYLDPERLQESMESATVLVKYIQNPDEFFVSKKLMKALPALYQSVEFPLETLKRDLKFAKTNGLLSKFGL